MPRDKNVSRPIARRSAERRFDEDPLWYKDAIIYEVSVRAFYDSNGDGVGDIRGLTDKLDYIADLGVTAIWLLPFCPSPLKDEGYDIADYTGIHSAYGTLRDFRSFLREAHRRGLRVITELVINHTSDQHFWFQRSRQSKPGSLARDFYVWSDTPERYRGARIIFKDFEPSNWTWDHVAKAYYWHRFYAHQPDLNYDSPAVRRAVLNVVDFWLQMGVDGLRLDAIPYLYEREGTSGDARAPQGAAQSRGRQVQASDLARRSEPVAGRRHRVLRERGRIADELSLPAHAAVVHGDPHGGRLSGG